MRCPNCHIVPITVQAAVKMLLQYEAAEGSEQQRMIEAERVIRGRKSADNSLVIHDIKVYPSNCLMYAVFGRSMDIAAYHYKRSAFREKGIELHPALCQFIFIRDVAVGADVLESLYAGTFNTGIFRIKEESVTESLTMPFKAVVWFDKSRHVKGHPA